MKIYISIIIVLLFTLIGCKEKHTCDSVQNIHTTSLVTKFSIRDKIANLEDSNNDQIIVVSHRGDWRNAPENSLQAIKNCIDLGVDMVEIDVRETKDGHLVLMHDKTIDRTTNGNGYVKDLTLDSLRTFRLIDGLGIATNHKIPTLLEALKLAKGKILVNLDKSYGIFDKCYEIINKTSTHDQVIIKGAKRLEEVEKEFGKYLDKVHFMPIINLPNNEVSKIVDEYLDSNNPPVAFEFTIKHDTIKFVENFKKIRDRGSSIWVNSLWPHHNGGHDDEKAVNDINTYQWYIENSIDIIQTDRPRLLLGYLKSKNLHK